MFERVSEVELAGREEARPSQEEQDATAIHLLLCSGERSQHCSIQTDKRVEVEVEGEGTQDPSILSHSPLPKASVLVVFT